MRSNARSFSAPWSAAADVSHRQTGHFHPSILRRTLLLGVAGAATGCSSLPAAGPTKSEIDEASKPKSGQTVLFALIDLSPGVTATMEKWGKPSLNGGFGNARRPPAQTIGIGDSVQIVIWEAAAGGLFSSPVVDRQASGSRSATIPEQIVSNDGMVTVPFAGRIRVAGRSTNQVEDAIVSNLQGKAVEPQALVTVTKNVSNTVTVLGESQRSRLVALGVPERRVLIVVNTCEVEPLSPVAVAAT